MIIEVWSDFSCPFCYIGKRKLENAIRDLKLENKVKIEYKSYQLNPDAPLEPIDGVEALSRLKGIPKDQVREMFNGVTEHAKTVGLNYKMDKMKYVSTFKAHRSSKLAKKYNKDHILNEKLMDGYFTKGLDVSDNDSLLKLAIESGLNEKEVIETLNSMAFESDVNQDILEAKKIGIQGVPFFIFGRKYAFSGAQPDQMFKQAITKAFEEMPKLEILQEDDSLTCDEDGCDI